MELILLFHFPFGRIDDTTGRMLKVSRLFARTLEEAPFGHVNELQ